MQSSIDRTGSRNGFDLIEAGLKTDRDYLAKVIAVSILLRRPSLLQN